MHCVDNYLGSSQGKQSVYKNIQILYRFINNFAACVQYCKLGNFLEGLIFAYAKFGENKILAKWRNHSVVY